ncbi:MAG: DUF1588 domain-containing protein [Deltaproteobacteria bacterium]|nr:DUF1588 domain-containing protein [Deltaproteobacteria bacterium]
MSRKYAPRSARVQAMTVGVIAMGAAFAGAGTGCSAEEVDDPSSPSCVSTREYFTNEVYAKALNVCAGCHTPGGAADQRGAKFKMYRDTYPDFVTANMDALRDYVKLDYDGKPLFLRKPLGERSHGGGPVLTETSEEYKILSKFVQDLRTGSEKTCDGNGQLGVDSLDGRETARKAGITLAGRVPTDEELAQAGTEEGLEALVLKLTNEELFYDRLREIWNDALLTERGLDAGVGGAFNNAPFLYDDRYPGYTTQNRGWTSASVTEEPMRFIEYVVRNNLPFSDVVAGNYLVANPYTAALYGVPHSKPLAPENFLAWERVDFTPVQKFEVDDAPRTSQVPVAGVLTTPSFLNRWETTRTNKGRKRARVVLKNFLATDILKFAQRPVDSTALTSVQNPTQNSAMCSVCHTVLDPIAGGFRGFNEQNLTRFLADDKWHDDMLPPGINAVQMPPTNYGNAAMWLGAQIPRDARFGISIAQVMYHGIVGDEPLSFPQDKADPDYQDRVRAFTIQNDWFVKTGREFEESKFDLRKLVVAIVKSPYFRAKSGDPTKDALHDGLGQGRLLGPEMLGRKYRATTGLYFFTNSAAEKDEARARDGYLRSDFVEDRDWRLVYGGIDSGDVTKRTDTMSPIMLATSQYSAGLVACRATSYDFTKPAAQRRLFRTVELTTTPFTVRANAGAELVAVPDAEAKIKETIKHLYFRLLGETVATDSPEVTRTYGLFVDVWRDLENTNLTDGGKSEGMSNYRCVAETDWDKPVRFEPDANGRFNPVFEKLRDRPDKAPYEPGMRLDRDENFTVRSWQAVMTYLLSDYRFTHE